MVPNSTNSRIHSFSLRTPHIEVVLSAGARSIRLSLTLLSELLGIIDGQTGIKLSEFRIVSALSDQIWSIVYPSAKGTRMSGQHACSTDF